MGGLHFLTRSSGPTRACGGPRSCSPPASGDNDPSERVLPGGPRLEPAGTGNVMLTEYLVVGTT
jgi:hypothetical protein